MSRMLHVYVHIVHYKLCSTTNVILMTYLCLLPYDGNGLSGRGDSLAELVTSDTVITGKLSYAGRRETRREGERGGREKETGRMREKV